MTVCRSETEGHNQGSPEQSDPVLSSFGNRKVRPGSLTLS